MLHWKLYRDEINTNLRDIRATKPDIMKTYATLHHTDKSSSNLDTKAHKLSSLGVSATLRCDGCIDAIPMLP